MNPALALLPVALIAYLLGSIPFGLLLTRAAGLGDVRTIGSGNIGATNVLRTGRKDVAAATLLLDGGKAAAAVLIARALAGPDAAVQTFAGVAGACAFLGHCYPVWLRFQGGKGVATFIGAALALIWPLGVAIAGIWLLTAAVFAYSSLAALVMMAAAPVLALAAGDAAAALALLIMALLSYLRHAGNIKRLLAGKETKIGRKA